MLGQACCDPQGIPKGTCKLHKDHSTELPHICEPCLSFAGSTVRDAETLQAPDTASPAASGPSSGSANDQSSSAAAAPETQQTQGNVPGQQNYAQSVIPQVNGCVCTKCLPCTICTGSIDNSTCRGCTTRRGLKCSRVICINCGQEPQPGVMPICKETNQQCKMSNFWTRNVRPSQHQKSLSPWEQAEAAGSVGGWDSQKKSDSSDTDFGEAWKCSKCSETDVNLCVYHDTNGIPRKGSNCRACDRLPPKKVPILATQITLTPPSTRVGQEGSGTKR